MSLKKIKKRYSIPGILLLFFIISIPISLHDGSIGEGIGSEYSTLAIRNVTVIPMDSDTNQTLPHQVVFIREGVIESIQQDHGQDIPADKTIDASGKYLIPGLMDAHAHYFDVADLPQTIAYGVTHARIMMGMPMHLRWRDKIQSGTIIGPNLIIATPTLNAGNDVGPFHLNLDNVDNVFLKIEDYHRKGYDFVKIYAGLNEVQVNEVFSAATSLNMKSAGHLPESVNPVLFLKNRPASIEHLESIAEVVFNNKPDSVNMERFAESLTNNKVVVVPTMGVINNYSRAIKEGGTFSKPYSSYVNPLIEKMFVIRNVERALNASEGLERAFIKENKTNQTIFRGLHQHGITIASGTDSGPMYVINGLSLLEELELYVDHGFSPYKALESATRNTAQLFGLNNSGQIRVGFNSNLVLLNKNPLLEISAIKDQEIVITQGKYFNAEDLASLKKLSKNKTGYYATIIRLLEHKLRL